MTDKELAVDLKKEIGILEDEISTLEQLVDELEDKNNKLEDDKVFLMRQIEYIVIEINDIYNNVEGI